MKKKIPLFWVAMAVCCLLALLALSVPGYRFSAGVLFGIAGVIGLYRLLRLLGRKKPKLSRVMQRVLTAGLCLVLLAAAITGVVVIQASFGNPEADCDYLIVLGAGVNGTVPSLSLRERLDAACDYLRSHPDAVCIVSGGQGSGEDITEAECMYRYLTGKGIDPERIIQEDKATSTQENLAYSLALIGPEQTPSVGILSSEYHLCRARMMARQLGIDPVMVPAETTWLSLRMNYYLREVAAIWYYMILGG